jgi:zinc transporter
MTRGMAAKELLAREAAEALALPDSVMWLHFSRNNARVQRWLATTHLIPDTLRDAIAERDTRCRVEATAEGLVVVIHDLTFDHESDPSEVESLWAYVTPRLLLSVRRHALKTTDELRSALRGGLGANSGIALMVSLFELRSNALRKLLGGIVEDVNDIEDQILGGRVTKQREHLGQVRRLCARVRRHFVPECAALHKLVERPPAWMQAQDREFLREVHDSLAFLLDDMHELHERAKMLQDELAARLAEATSRNLYLLAILTAVFLPMTLITGIFGMNVAGLPGTEGTAGFWWVMALIVAAGAVTFGVLFLKKLF